MDYSAKECFRLFKITSSAYDVLEQAIKNERNSEDEKLFVRLTMGIGWGAPKVKLSLEEQPIQGDQVHSFGQLDLLIHENDFVYFNHTKLDYTVDVLRKGRFHLIRI